MAVSLIGCFSEIVDIHIESVSVNEDMATSTQQMSRANFRFVPLQDFTRSWTDADLYAKYGLTEDEIAFIESMIKPME